MRMSRLPSLVALVTIAVITFQAAVPAVCAAPTSGAKVGVRIENFTFSPAVVTVKPGTQITWTNGDDIPHTVVSDNKAFKSKVLATGEKFSYIAARAGTYPYSCTIHPNMIGKLVVQ